mgnify:CR=1 FL=1
MGQILLADDVEFLRKLYGDIVSSTFPNYEVEFFQNGGSLVERLERGVGNIALILTDNSMPPGPTGSEIIRKYAKSPKFDGTIPFILSYAGDEEIGKKAIEDGAFSFIQKPFDLSQLVDIIQKAFDKYKK